MNCIKSTDFSYLGLRRYINSTSLIEYIHDNIDTFTVDYSLDIKMHKEIHANCRVDVYDYHHEYSDEIVMCEVVLKSNNSKRFVYFLNNHGAITKSAVEATYCAEEIELHGKFSGKYRISASNYNEFIKNIIQSNKLLHFKNVALEEFKVLNMFMKNVPVELPEYKDILDIEIKNIGIRDAGNGSLSTLNSINVVGIDLQPILVGFKVVRLET